MAERTTAQETAEEIARGLFPGPWHYPRCPKCGEQDEYWTDGAPRHASDGSRWSKSCGHCEHEYEVELRVSYSFHVERPASGIEAAEPARPDRGSTSGESPPVPQGAETPKSSFPINSLGSGEESKTP